MSFNDSNNNQHRDNVYDNYAIVNDYENANPITMQPQSLQSEYPGTRRPIPVSTLDWRSMDRSQFIPVNGLDFLIGVPSILIQQTVELGDMMSRTEPENRYILKVPDGETLYMSNELSSPLQRLLCGSRRSFTISLSDHSRQEALVLRRRLAASSCCFPCRLQELTVLAPPGDYLGRIHQVWTLNAPLFLIKNTNDDLLFVVEGPTISMCCGPLDAEFKILSADAMIQQGIISHRLDTQLSSYIMTVQFPTATVDPRVKALIIGAAFLLEYTYFVGPKSRKLLKCC